MKYIFLIWPIFLFVHACFCANLVIDGMNIDLSGNDVNLQESFGELIVKHWREKKPYKLAIIKSGPVDKSILYPFDADAFLNYVNLNDSGRRGLNPITRELITAVAVFDLMPLPLPDVNEIPESFFEFIRTRFNTDASKRLQNAFRPDINQPIIIKTALSQSEVFNINQFMRRLVVNPILVQEYDKKQKVLLLSDHVIEKLPDNFFEELSIKLPDLKTINLSHNKLTEISASVSKLLNLEALIIGDNDLTTLPKTIGKLRRLRYLFAGNNKLEVLPDSLWKLRQLSELYLAHNKLSEISPLISNLVHLRSLDVSWNQIIELPKSIGGLISLENLNILHNPLQRLPETVTRLINLKKIFADDIQHQISPETFELLKNRGVNFG